MTTSIKAFALTGMGIVLLAGGAIAQPAPAPAAPPARTGTAPVTTPPAATTTTPRAGDTQRGDAPVAGANSFTERQAQSRITDAGYSQVTGMTQGSDGVWRGRAMRNGVAEDVALDYRGEIFAGASARATATGTRSDNAAPATPRR